MMFDLEGRIDKTIKDFKNMGIYQFILSGVEPSLNHKYYDRVQELGYNIHVRIQYIAGVKTIVLVNKDVSNNITRPSGIVDEKYNVKNEEVYNTLKEK